MRHAVFKYLAGDDAWALSIESLFELLDGFYGHIDGPLTQEEREMVEHAIGEIVHSIVLNTDDPDEVKGEIDNLGLVKIISDLPFAYEFERLHAHATHLAERRERDDDQPPPAPPTESAASDPELDIDELFSGLTDR